MLLRLEFSKEEEVRYLSHLEILRLFERALRRAEIPLAFSEGFNPHPKMAFGPPAAVGVAGSKEYLDLELNGEMVPANLLEKLQQKLPLGIKLKKIKEIKTKVPALMASIERAGYEVKTGLKKPTGQAELEQAIECLLKRPSIIVMRQGKDGLQQKEIRNGIFKFQGRITGQEVIFELEVQAGSTGNVRPGEVIRALAQEEQLPLQTDYLKVLRTGLYLIKDGVVLSPLEIV